MPLPMRSTLLLGSFVLLACVTTTGCKKKKKQHEKIVGSCDRPADPDALASSHVCSDYYDEKLLKSTCTGKREVVASTPCDRAGALGACKGEDDDRWYYLDGTMDAQGLAKLCGKDRPVILPGGGTFTAKSDSAVNADKRKENLAKYGPKVKSNLAAIAAITRLPAPTGKVDAQGLKGDAIVLHAEDLADPEHPKTLAYRLAETDRLGVCQGLVAGRATPKEDGSILYSCAERPFFAVVSVGTFKEPSSTGQTNDGKTKTTFVAKGRIAGDVFLFRSDSGKFLGSFPFNAENGPISSSNNSIEKIRAELFESYTRALSSGASKAAPSLAAVFSTTK